QDGKLNAPIRKGLKTSQKFYCCPIEGCPRGPNRPFSQFSLVKQHFMKMHAEKKHKCDKCSNSYGTEWYLKRHIEVCGKTFQCTCGCPYASRTALLSHIYRTGHEIPAEHRDPPSKKRKMETSVHNQQLAEKANEAFINTHNNNPGTRELESSEVKLVASLEGSCSSNFTNQMQPKCTPKMLLPKPKVALVKLPVMQLAQLPIYVSATDSSVKPAVVAVDNQGSVVMQMDQAVMCSDIFDDVHSSYNVSTHIELPENNLMPANIDQTLLQRSNCKSLNQDTVKSESLISFNTQTNILPPQNTMDNQTQTMDLLSDLENIFSGNMSGQTLDNHRGLLSETSSNADTHLPSGPSQSTGIDFDIEEFFSASNIQTQTEESELGTLNSEPVLESLDIETQTDFLFSDSATQSYSCRGNSNFLGLEMFDTQTQTDLNFFLDSNTHLPLGSILKQSSFSMSTDSSDTETQTEVYPATKNIPTQNIESKVQLSSAETQTMDSCFENL
ncbi:ATMIN protein, partial [Fregata magnificens]|nr:ATMIN protein [Fregata magnificens]